MNRKSAIPYKKSEIFFGPASAPAVATYFAQKADNTVEVMTSENPLSPKHSGQARGAHFLNLPGRQTGALAKSTDENAKRDSAGRGVCSQRPTTSIQACKLIYPNLSPAGVYRSQPGHSSSLYSRISPGWQSSASQMASSVEKRIAFALPVFRMERLEMVRSTFSESSVRLIFRLASITSRFTMMAIAIRLSLVLPAPERLLL